jgi:cytochrome c551/c552
MRHLLGILATTAICACYLDVASDDPRALTSAQGGDGGASSNVVPMTGQGTSGLPCDVDAVMKTNGCLNCHGASPSAPMALLSYEDFVAPAKSDPTRKVAELVVQRMRDTVKPMPPQGLAPGAQADVVQAWIQAGYPKGMCGQVTDGGPPPINVQCTSNVYWSRGNKGDKDMNPGKACVSCHSSTADVDKDAPRLLGGTLYPSFNEPDLCSGFYGGSVVINDAAGRTYTLAPNYAGNFYLDPGSPVTFPIRAKVVHNGKERVMNAAQMTGDCNSCHTERGTNGAPGRVALP